MAEDQNTEARIVEGTGVVAVSADTDRALRIEQAMSSAIMKAIDDGVTDPAEQRERMMAARDEALNEASEG